ncbi:M4 family metallopeptidase [Mesoterricola sediminis]|uniref:Neutral metalloproteinase n=1 Tax=Mesoterricola sediminis TaxID=2927980 RepID=A0AA48H3N4_9BACT|nr:M4 family metallopeptidase [Mesoterricola sediminis]BDU76876.1 peptidase [Mesoterricola sediminis]
MPVLPLLFLCLTVLAGAAAPPDPEASAALAEAQASLAALGLPEGTGFRLRDVVADGPGAVHVRLQQTWRGVPVWGGQIILHRGPAGPTAPPTDALVRDIALDVTPNLQAAEALAVVRGRPGCPADGVLRPPDLVLWPATETRIPEGADGADPAAEPVVVRHHLAWHARVEVGPGAREPRCEDVLVDAHTGAVLRAWSTLYTARRNLLEPPREGKPAEGTGRSQYSGEVPLGALASGLGYELLDPTRGGITTRNLGGATAGPGAPCASATPTWGDGLDYDPGRGPGSVNGQTAAVDAHFGLQSAWDFCRNVLGRNGIDGLGTPPVNRVHYAEGFDNAFWSDDCFCMTFGDGAGGRPYTTLDVVGHELAHGLCNATAGLDYEGEPGGLCEANSDILGVLIRHYVKRAGGRGPVIPDGPCDWTIGAEVAGTPIRTLDRPSRDRISLDAWSPTLAYRDVHQASGPMNRAFTFLAQGASARRGHPAYSPRLPHGMAGIGLDKALRIWWRTLTTRLTPRSGYRQARAGALACAQELYGPRSPEWQAVDLAFRGVNVGRPRRR